jgi:hypothetical protein
MFYDNDNRVGKINEIEQKISLLEHKEPPQKGTGYWQKLTTYCEKLSADQLNFINTNNMVMKKHRQLMKAFNLFLFERYKEEFAQVECMKPLCDEYIDTIEKCGAEYGENIKNTVEENAKLKNRITELERKLNETSRTRQGGKVHT